MSEPPPAGVTFSAPARLFIKTERAVLSAAKQPSQAAAVVNPQAGDFKRHELHSAVVFFTVLETRLDHPWACAPEQQPDSSLPSGFPFQSLSALQQRIAGQDGGCVGLPHPSRPPGGLACLPRD